MISYYYLTRDWYSGIMTAFQADEKGSIPLSRSNFYYENICEESRFKNYEVYSATCY